MKSLNENDQKQRTIIVREHRPECSWNYASFSLNMSDITQVSSTMLIPDPFLSSNAHNDRWELGEPFTRISYDLNGR
jgi:hypothetical protein